MRDYQIIQFGENRRVKAIVRVLAVTTRYAFPSQIFLRGVSSRSPCQPCHFRFKSSLSEPVRTSVPTLGYQLLWCRDVRACRGFNFAPLGLYLSTLQSHPDIMIMPLPISTYGDISNHDSQREFGWNDISGTSDFIETVRYKKPFFR